MECSVVEEAAPMLVAECHLLASFQLSNTPGLRSAFAHPMRGTRTRARAPTIEFAHASTAAFATGLVRWVR